MRREFSNWEEMIKAASKEVYYILKEDVAPVAEDILRKHIKTDIYDISTQKGFPQPGKWVKGTTYQRRHVLEDSITSYVDSLYSGLQYQLLTTSTAMASPSIVKGYSFQNRYAGSFLKLLESGNTGIWRKGFPRPAVSNTQEEINNSSEIKRAIKSSISKRIGKSYEF